MKTETIQIAAGAATLSATTYVPIFASETLGADELFVSLLVGSYASASFVSSYLFGRAGDVYDRRLILRLGLLFSTVGFGLLLFAYSEETLFLVRLLNGFSLGMYPGALAAYAYDSHMKMGRFASFGALGWGAGTFLAGLSAAFFMDLRMSFAVASLFFAIAFASAMSLTKIEQVRIKVPLFPVATFKRNAAPYLAILLRHSSASALWTLWPLFLRSLGGDYVMIAISQAINSLAQVVFMVVLTDRINSRSLVSLGLVSSGATFFWFMLANNILDILPSQILLGFSWACLYVGSLRYVTESSQERATAVGLLQSMLSMASILGPVFAAIMFSVWQDYVHIILFGVVMSLVSFVAFVALDARQRRTPAIDTQTIATVPIPR